MISSWLPQNVSSFGGDIDWVFHLILYVVGFWFVLAEGVLLYFIVRYRRRQGRPAFFNRGETAREAAWILVPALIVLGLDLGIDAATGPVWDRVKTQLPASELTVEVNAKQFNWEFVYPGPDGKLGTADDVTVENELHVPAGKVVRFVLSSQDVVHSFFIPNMRLKQDIVPGRKISGWFKAIQPGTYPIACAELCGFGHYTMGGSVVVQTPEEYRQWMKEHSAPASARAESPDKTTAN